MEFRDYEVLAYASSPLFERLESAGYKMAVYDAELLPDDGGMGRFENILPNDNRKYVKGFYDDIVDDDENYVLVEIKPIKDISEDNNKIYPGIIWLK